MTNVKERFQSFLTDTEIYFDYVMENLDEIQEMLGYALEFAEEWKEKTKTRKEKNIIKESIEETKKELEERIELILIEVRTMKKNLETFEKKE